MRLRERRRGEGRRRSRGPLLSVSPCALLFGGRPRREGRRCFSINRGTGRLVGTCTVWVRRCLARRYWVSSWSFQSSLSGVCCETTEPGGPSSNCQVKITVTAGGRCSIDLKQGQTSTICQQVGETGEDGAEIGSMSSPPPTCQNAEESHSQGCRGANRWIRRIIPASGQLGNRDSDVGSITGLRRGRYCQVRERSGFQGHRKTGYHDAMMPERILHRRRLWRQPAAASTSRSTRPR